MSRTVMSRAAAIALVVLSVFAGDPGSVIAAESGGGSAPSTVYAGVSVYRGGWRGTGSSCKWEPHNARSAASPLYLYKQVGSITYRLFDKSCPGPTLEYVWVPDLPPRQLSFNATAYLERILPPPRATFAPPASKGVVTVGTWFWINPADWAPVTVTAWVPTPTGSRWATATATPVRLQFEPGDGALGTGSITCTAPGTRWTAMDGDTARSPSGCQYTYQHSSAVAANGSSFPARVTIVWDVSWRGSSGAGGYAGQLRTSSTYAMTVREIQALVAA